MLPLTWTLLALYDSLVTQHMLCQSFDSVFKSHVLLRAHFDQVV